MAVEHGSLNPFNRLNLMKKEKLRFAPLAVGFVKKCLSWFSAFILLNTARKNDINKKSNRTGVGVSVEPILYPGAFKFINLQIYKFMNL